MSSTRSLTPVISWVGTLWPCALVVMLVACSADSAGTAEDPTSPTPVPLTFASVSAGGKHTCGVTTSSDAYCWGANHARQLGTGGFSDQILVPTLVVGGLTFQSASAARFHTCGLTQSGDAYCWGPNEHGEGGGSTLTPNPMPVSGGLSFQSVSAGEVHSCGVTTGGDAYCWGGNGDGQLGDGTQVRRLTPTPVSGGLVFQSISAGVLHTCALTTGGDAYCWGRKSDGELGDGSNTGPEQCIGANPCSTTPLAVAGGLTFQSVSAGSAHTCGLTTDGDAYCWGSNLNGKLGDGSDTGPEQCVGGNPCSTTPLAVAGGHTFQSVSAGRLHSCAVTTGGEAYCWGRNDDGQLGDGTTAVRLLPTRVFAAVPFQSVSAGRSHTCGHTTDGDAYCWGLNGWGQLGNSTQVSSSVPVKVSAPK